MQVHDITKVPARRAPEIGEHNEEILRELGFDANEIDGLRASGAVPHVSHRKKQQQDVDDELTRHRRTINKKGASMATQKQVKTGSEQSSEEKLQKLREIYADASEIGKTALENVIRALKSDVPAEQPAARIESAGRIGRRQARSRS